MCRVPIRNLLIAFLGVFAVVAAVFAWSAYQFNSPVNEAENSRETIVYLAPGMTLGGVVKTLGDAGLVARPMVFEWGVRLSGAGRKLKSGEYALSSAMSARQIMNVLVAGNTVLHAITIPEGLTTSEIFAILMSDERLSGDLPAQVGEGALLPETYKYQRGDSRSELLDRMENAMSEAVSRLWSSRKPELPLGSLTEAVILASIIEKETAAPEERARIAGVFVNRLRRGMRLQSDPTVVYALTSGKGTLGRALTFDDLRVDSPFNTYQVKGLPPGPIANPGLAALEAAVQPDDTDALYFVADGKGGHAFAKSLNEHHKNVRRWRALNAKRRTAR